MTPDGLAPPSFLTCSFTTSPEISLAHSRCHVPPGYIPQIPSLAGGPQPCVLARQGEPCEPCSALSKPQNGDSHVVALQGPPGEKGEPGPPGFGLPGKQVSSRASRGCRQGGERRGPPWVSWLPGQWGVGGSPRQESAQVFSLNLYSLREHRLGSQDIAWWDVQKEYQPGTNRPGFRVRVCR